MKVDKNVHWNVAVKMLIEQLKIQKKKKKKKLLAKKEKKKKIFIIKPHKQKKKKKNCWRKKKKKKNFEYEAPYTKSLNINWNFLAKTYFCTSL